MTTNATLLDRVTPVILTRDEEVNIGRTLERLAWARDVVIIDSLSTDATERIARSFGNVRFIERAFDDLAAQWGFGAAQAHTDWILTLDADYVVPDEFIAEMAALSPADGVTAYEAGFIYAVGGRPLRSTLYTARAVLLRRDSAKFYMDGHTQRVRIAGRTATLHSRLVHDDRKSLRRFIERQKRYMRDEAAKLRTAIPGELNAAARVRRLRIIAPLIIVPYVLFVKGLILDGRAGVRYAFERFIAETLLARELFRRPVASRNAQSP